VPQIGKECSPYPSESNGESRTASNFEININRDQWVNYTSRGPFPTGYSLTDLKAFLLFVKFKVPYDDKYRYEPFGFIFKQDSVVSKTNSNSYKLSPMESKDTMVYVKKHLGTLKNMSSQSLQYVKDFFVDYKAD